MNTRLVLRSLTIAFATIAVAEAQNPSSSRLEFEVASIKRSRPDGRRFASFPLGPGSVYDAKGGNFSARNQTLITYLFFAYKIDGNQGQYLKQQLSGWAKTELFDIEARAAGKPDKDQMRLMMRALLSKRFNLALHSETREVSGLAISLAKRGVTGPQLRSHLQVPPCPATSESNNDETVAGGFPLLCGGVVFQVPGFPGQTRRGARNITLIAIADALSAEADLGRPMFDRTGLKGSFDFTLEWTPENRITDPMTPDLQPDQSALSFQRALREQLGLKLGGIRTSMDVLVVDRIERPTEN